MPSDPTKHKGKPRGFYKEDLSWSKDKDADYFSGNFNRFVWPVLKAAVLGGLFTIFSSFGQVFAWVTTMLVLMFY